MSEDKVYLSKVVMEDDQIVMLYTKELMKALELVENEIFQWDLSGDDIVLKRLGVMTPTSQE